MTSPIEEIKNRLDIVEVISGYIQLTQAGANFRARCPFHNEKTPSFMVSKEKQIWHCFGCDKGGDLITFVQEYEGISFAEALKILADKANVPLANYDFRPKEDLGPLYNINQLAADYYSEKLNDGSAASQKVLAYLKNRQVSDESIKKWRLGLSGESWDELYHYLSKQGYSDEQIFQAGLIIKKKSSSGYLDRFRKRLMFPIADSQNRIVAFTSRILTGIVYEADEEMGGKYINSPQTVIYDKSRILYGWSMAKEAIRQKKYVILVEGNMDAILASQAGTANVVAASGTALTSEHLKLIKRHTNNMILAFDGDAAGSRAAFRAFTLGWQADMNLKILLLFKGQDPADMIKNNPADWIKAVKESVPVMDYYFKRIIAGVDLSRSDHKKIAVDRLLPIIKYLKSQVEQSHYLKLLADKLQIPLEILQRGLEQSKSIIGEERSQAIRTAKTEQEKNDLLEILSEKLLALAFFKTGYLENIITELAPETLAESLRNLYRKVIIYYTKHQSLDNFRDFSELEKEEKETWIKLALIGERDYSDFSDKDLAKDFRDLYYRLRWQAANLERDRLIKELRQAELSGDNNFQDDLMRKINLLNKDINKWQV